MDVSLVSEMLSEIAPSHLVFGVLGLTLVAFIWGRFQMGLPLSLLVMAVGIPMILWRWPL